MTLPIGCLCIHSERDFLLAVLAGEGRTAQRLARQRLHPAPVRTARLTGVWWSVGLCRQILPIRYEPKLWSLRFLKSMFLGSKKCF